MSLFFRTTAEIYKPDSRAALNLRILNMIVSCPWYNLGGLYSVCFGATYDPVLSRISKEDTVIDGGANIGMFTLLAARRAKHVVAVEPNLINFGFLRRNVEQNRLSNVSTVNAALWVRDGEMAFEGAGEIGRLDPAGKETVQTRTIDSLSCEPPSIVKLDIEGAEAAAFTTFSRRERLRAFVYERDDRALHRILASGLTLPAEASSYSVIEKSLTESGFRWSSYSGSRVAASRLVTLDLIRTEVSTRLFGARFGLSALINAHENVLRPNYGDGFDIRYALTPEERP
jgi:FkbM family methyltransferase